MCVCVGGEGGEEGGQSHGHGVVKPEDQMSYSGKRPAGTVYSAKKKKVVIYLLCHQKQAHMLRPSHSSDITPNTQYIQYYIVQYCSMLLLPVLRVCTVACRTTGTCTSVSHSRLTSHDDPSTALMICGVQEAAILQFTYCYE